MDKEDKDTIQQMVRERYSKVAVNQNACGCATSCCGATQPDLDSLSRLMGYSRDDVTAAAAGANLGLGCGNPTAIASLRPGETVLDLGSGAGFDCFLASRQVGDAGRVVGVDMTPEMVAKARENARKMGVDNVEFRLGEIENLPVSDDSIDVIFSNCVINLSPQKQAVFKEAFRVLKPGGRLAISDVVGTADMPDALRGQAALLTGCIAGAERVETIRQYMEAAGFEAIRIDLKPYSKELVSGWFPGSGAENVVASADIAAVKPVRDPA